MTPDVNAFIDRHRVTARLKETSVELAPNNYLKTGDLAFKIGKDIFHNKRELTSFINVSKHVSLPTLQELREIIELSFEQGLLFINEY